MTNSFYNKKKLMQGLGLPVEKIHCCNNRCMIYWGKDNELISCNFVTILGIKDKTSWI